jgi:hypothetical protein
MATLVQETTTDWKADYRLPCHKYLLERNKCIGYIKEGTNLLIRFPKPMYFDQRGRTFKKVMDV